MYKFSEKINKCQDFSIINDTLITISSDNKLNFDSKFIREGELSLFGKYEDFVNIFDEEKFTSLIYNNTGKLIKEIKPFALQNIYQFENGQYLVGGNDGINTFYGIFDFNKFKLLKRFEKLGLNGISKVINDNLFFTQNNKKFALYTFENKCVWEIYTEDLLKDSDNIRVENIFIIGNLIYLSLDKTYCFDLETGNLKNTYKQIFTCIKNNTLYGLQISSRNKFELTILETKEKQLNINDLSNEFNKYNIYPDNKILVKNDLVYFTQNMGDNFAKFGVFNFKSNKILTKYDFDSKNGMIRKLEVTKNEIYIHMQDKTLHKFEEENVT